MFVERYIEHVYDLRMRVEPPSEPQQGDGVAGSVEPRPDAVDAELAQVAGELNAANARLVAITEQLLDTDGWQQGGMRTPSQFLGWKMGLSPERARAVIAVAERRSEFPAVIGSFEAGELSLEQVVEAVKAPAWADHQIQHFCTIATVSKLRRAMRSNMFVGDPDDERSAPKPIGDRVSFGIGRDGRWRIRGEFGLDDGRLIEAALRERRDDLSTGDEHATWPEAFVDCLRRSLDAVESPARRDQFRTWLHLDVTDGTATTTDGWRIPRAVADQVLCDGVVQPVWGTDGVPFSVGRTQRIVPARTRRIIEHRDRGCRIPGCAGEHVEIHHIVHWLDGGPTDTSNLISLCPAHHRMHHRGELRITGDADTFGDIEFADADGDPIAPRGSPVTPTRPPPPAPAYRSPVNGRFDWNWIGLGWIHPHEQRRRRDLLQQHHRRRSA